MPGRAACSWTSSAGPRLRTRRSRLLALEYGVPLLVAAGRKLGEPMRYLAQVQDVILPEDYQAQPDAVRAITQRFTTDLEQLVRACPRAILLAAPPLETSAAAAERTGGEGGFNQGSRSPDSWSTPAPAQPPRLLPPPMRGLARCILPNHIPAVL